MKPLLEDSFSRQKTRKKAVRLNENQFFKNLSRPSVVRNQHGKAALQHWSEIRLRRITQFGMIE